MKTFFRDIGDRLYAMITGYMLATGIMFAAVVGMNRFQNRTYDNALLLKAAGLIAADTDHPVLEVGNAQMLADLVVDISAIEVATGDETYAVILEGSPDIGFGTPGNIRVLGRYVFGAAAGAMVPAGAATTVGRYTFPVNNMLGNNIYPYIRLRTDVTGTIATGINFSAWLAKRAS